MCIDIHVYVYIYIIEREREGERGAPRNPAPRSRFWRGLSNHQAATAQIGTRQAELFTEDRK